MPARSLALGLTLLAAAFACSTAIVVAPGHDWQDVSHLADYVSPVPAPGRAPRSSPVGAPPRGLPPLAGFAPQPASPQADPPQGDPLQPAKAHPSPLVLSFHFNQLNTFVGQAPQLVAMIGNTGNTPISDDATTCFYDKEILRYDSLVFSAQDLIPGQFYNVEYTFTAIAPGYSEIFCKASGIDTMTGEVVLAQTGNVTVTVNPAQG